MLKVSYKLKGELIELSRVKNISALRSKNTKSILSYAFLSLDYRFIIQDKLKGVRVKKTNFSPYLLKQKHKENVKGKRR